jgi:hypothetical protein
MTTNIFSKLDIAYCEIETIQTWDKDDIIIYLKKYVGYNIKSLEKRKSQKYLAELLYNQTNILRQSLKDKENTAILLEALEIKERKNEDKPITIKVLKDVINKGKLDGHGIGKYLFELCNRVTTNGNTISKTYNDDLNFVLKNIDCNPILKTEIKESWDKLIRPINYARCDLDTQRKKSYSEKAEKSIDAKPVIEWALENLNSTKQVYLGLALSILSGRRMVEIFGTSKYSLGQQNGILIEGIAKKKETQTNFCEFIPLVDSKLWLHHLERLESMGYRNKTPRQINDSVARMASRDFPEMLKNVDVNKFKDARDFYAGFVYATFNKRGVNIPLVFTQYIMGHDSSDSTAYYQKFEILNIETIPNFDDIYNNFLKFDINF